MRCTRYTKPAHPVVRSIARELPAGERWTGPTRIASGAVRTYTLPGGGGPAMSRSLWVVQWLLALFIVLASGAPKLVLPPEALPLPIPVPPSLLRLIGVA